MFKKKWFELSYVLVLVSDDLFLFKIEIMCEQWVLYVYGEIFELISVFVVGFWVLICDGLLVGFGKIVVKMVKNFFFKGLWFLVIFENVMF